MDRLSLSARAKAIWTAGLRAVRADRLLTERVGREGCRLRVGGVFYSLSGGRRVFLVAMGKAAVPMALSLSRILGPHLTRGAVLCPPGLRLDHPRLKSLRASHPLPDIHSLRAARAILALAREAGPDALFIVLLSGGASAQVCLPAPGLALEEKRFLTERLLRAGADIFELNAVRKHLSEVKGGRLAQATYPAEVLNLVLSDVRRNDLETIGSGPTHWDTTTYADARRILTRYDLWRTAPAGARSVIERGLRGELPETPKKGSAVFRRVRSFVIGDIRTALKAAAVRARELGFETRLITATDWGEARGAAQRYATRLRKVVDRRPAAKPVCLLAGGELSVTVHGPGRGGRNSEFVLAALGEMEKAGTAAGGGRGRRSPGWLVASLGTDGVDGPTDAAGAWASAGIAAKARRLGLDLEAYLDRNDAYSFFHRTESLIKTGPTGTNVMDLRLFLVEGP
jgi:glycerate 2-kinase